MMREHEVKAAFRAGGVRKMSGYGIKRFYRAVSKRLPPGHEGHRVIGMVRTNLRTSADYMCSCGATVHVESKQGGQGESKA